MQFCRPPQTRARARHRPALDADLRATVAQSSSWSAMDCMGTPTWVRHVQQTEWSFEQWHSTCPVRPVAHASCTNPVHTSNARPPSSLAARGRNSLAGQWQPTSSSTRRPRRHPQVGSALMPSTRSRPSAAGPSPSCRLTPMADHDRPSDRWAAVRGSCRRLPSDRLWTCRDHEMHAGGAWVMAVT